ncbi:hypothetical protein B0T10DRAFT_93124 [Thelonectria olida]|uniref:Uncharacterized protein n=1 Tax=Thelonectria olida TaxID=1576542 RepID=A0A9P9AJC0_9HYPO|nr:hypothetical protein B0T10DRAFT_93124 [Thelonectria olida]
MSSPRSSSFRAMSHVNILFCRFRSETAAGSASACCLSSFLFFSPLLEVKPSRRLCECMPRMREVLPCTRRVLLSIFTSGCEFRTLHHSKKTGCWCNVGWPMVALGVETVMRQCCHLCHDRHPSGQLPPHSEAEKGVEIWRWHLTTMMECLVIHMIRSPSQSRHRSSHMARRTSNTWLSPDRHENVTAIPSLCLHPPFRMAARHKLYYKPSHPIMKLISSSGSRCVAEWAGFRFFSMWRPKEHCKLPVRPRAEITICCAAPGRTAR